MDKEKFDRRVNIRPGQTVRLIIGNTALDVSYPQDGKTIFDAKPKRLTPTEAKQQQLIATYSDVLLPYARAKIDLMKYGPAGEGTERDSAEMVFLAEQKTLRGLINSSKLSGMSDKAVIREARIRLYQGATETLHLGEASPLIKDVETAVNNLVKEVWEEKKS